MNIQEFVKYQCLIKEEIHKAFIRNKLKKTLALIDCYADCSQRINNILRDDEIESVIKEISHRYIDSSKDIDNGGDSDTVVFLDFIGTTACLGLQYIRGLVSNGYRVIYVYVSKNPINLELYNEVKQHCCKYYLYNESNVFDDGQYLGQSIHNTIVGANPSKILVHPHAGGALGMSVLHSIHGAKKYRIVPGDHHFYIGYDCFNFFIEFRPFGWSTAIYERRIPANKIYNLSYYPIIDEFVQFNGLPSATNGKIILAAGGATYKFQGSNVFYDLLSRILNENDGIAFVFLGNPSRQLVAMSQQERYKGKIYFLGYRKDFAAVIKNIDILINSMPFSGGLFCQTAAYFSKPILAFSESTTREDNSVDDILGMQDNSDMITLSTIDTFCQHAKHLVESDDYRRHWGEIAHNKLQTKIDFDIKLGQILEEQSPTLNGNDVKYVDRTLRIKCYLKINNEETPDYLLLLSRTLRFEIFKFIFKMPKCMLQNFIFIMRHILASFKYELQNYLR